jgi:hypothetical protein
MLLDTRSFLIPRTEKDLSFLRNTRNSRISLLDSVKSRKGRKGQREDRGTVMILSWVDRKVIRKRARRTRRMVIRIRMERTRRMIQSW